MPRQPENGVNLAHYAWIAAVTGILYGRSLFFQLTYLDDNVFFLEKLEFLRNWANWPKLFSANSFLESGGVFYRPLLIASMMLDAALGNGNLVLSHGMNLLFHAASSCMVYTLLFKLGNGQNALPLALLFCAHPISAQAVSWLPGRTDSLLAVWVLGSFNSFLDFVDSKKARHACLHLLLLAAALLTKELAVMLPVACLLYLWARGLRPHPWIFLGWLSCVAAWAFARRAALGGAEAYSAGAAIGSMISNLPAALSYLGKMSWPAGYCSYPILKDMRLFGGAAALAATLTAFLLRPPRRPRLAFWALSWWLLFLLPSFVYPRSHIEPVFFEYRAYLPLFGLLAAWGENGLLRDGGGRRALSLVLAAFAVAAFLNSARYRDGLSYWESAAACSPHSAFAHKQLGVMHYFRRDHARAESEYAKALALNPREPLVHNNLGVLHLASGRLDLAEREFLVELELNPNYDHALFNLGLVHYRKGNAAKARAFWERTLQVRPDYPEAAAYLEQLRRIGA